MSGVGGGRVGQDGENADYYHTINYGISMGYGHTKFMCYEDRNSNKISLKYWKLASSNLWQLFIR